MARASFLRRRFLSNIVLALRDVALDQGNAAGIDGGGVHAYASGVLNSEFRVSNASVSHNSAGRYGGGTMWSLSLAGLSLCTQ